MLYVVLEVIETIRLICNIKGWEIKFLSIIELIGLFAMLSVVAEIGLNSSWSSAGTIQVFPDVSTWVSGSISDMDGDTVTDA